MPGMNSGLSATNPTLVAAFRTALAHQGLVVLALLLVLALIRFGVREWAPPAKTAIGSAVGAAEPRARRLLRLGFGLLWILDGLLQAQRAMAAGLPQVTSVLGVGTGAATSLLAAWSVNGGQSWALSQPLRAGAGDGSGAPSVSFGADGSASAMLPSGRGATIGWQAASWQALPALPARTAGLASPAAASLPEALAASGGTLSVWQLAAVADAGSSASTGRHWKLAQTVKVSIPYGSSG